MQVLNIRVRKSYCQLTSFNSDQQLNPKIRNSDHKKTKNDLMHKNGNYRIAGKNV